MDKCQDMKLGEVRILIHGITRIHDIYYWKNYGCVCTGLGTTNGSLSILTEIILAKFKDMEQQKKEINDSSYKIEIHLTKESDVYNLSSLWEEINPIIME